VIAEATPDVDFILADARKRGEVHHRAVRLDVVEDIDDTTSARQR
jgi:hypothetical protein